MTETNTKIVSKDTQIAEKFKNLTNNVLSQISDLTKQGKLQLPPNYSASNAINMMRLQIVDDEKLSKCTLTSVANAMIKMCSWGLNPAKNQCYMIPCDGKLTLFVSYFGYQLIAKRADPNIDEIVADYVTKGEEFLYDYEPGGNFVITKHTRTLETMSSDEYVAGYAIIRYKDGKPPRGLVMTWKDILDSWRMSPMKPVLEDGSLKTNAVHYKSTKDMIKRTLISKITKNIRNSSDDSYLFSEAVEGADLNEKQAESQEIVESKTSSEEIVDIDYSVIGEETGEVTEPDSNVVE